jgi:DNA-binding FadR family transcriptional regulator
MMDVSRTVVREAIRTLTGKGLVKRAPRRTRVSGASTLDREVLRGRLETSDMDSYLTKLFQLRCAVEPAAAALAATSAGEADIARIRAGYEGMAAATVNEEFVAADIAFHQAIYFATRNEFFWPIAQMFDITLRQSFTIAARGSHRARALVEHNAVLDAIAARNAEAARDASSVLLKNSADDLLRTRPGIRRAIEELGQARNARPRLRYVADRAPLPSRSLRAAGSSLHARPRCARFRRHRSDCATG